MASNSTDATNTDAYQQLLALFNSYGLGDLAGTILKYVQQGYDPATIQVMLRSEPVYQQRFAGNQQRIKNGLNALSEADYVATENTYRNLLHSYGLPQGFYDSQSDLANWIGSDVSPQELDQRLQVKKNLLDTADQATKDSLQSLYGLSEGDMLAHIVDPNAATPILEKQARAVQFGAAQERAGLRIADQARAEQMANLQLSDQQLRQGEAAVAYDLPTAEKLGAIDKVNVNQSTLEDAYLATDPEANKKVNKLASQERARFSGQSGIGQGSLAAKPNQY